MNKLQTSFVKALLFAVALHLVLILVLFLLGNFEVEDFTDVLPITTLLFFIAPFLSFQFFDAKKKKISDFLKPAFLSFVLLHIIVFIFFRLIKNEATFSLFETTSIFNGIVAFFVSMFFSGIQLINFKGKSIKSIDFNQIKYSLKKIIMISLVGTIMYSAIILLSSSYEISILQIWYKFFPIGFLLSLLTVHVFNYIYAKYKQSRRIFYIITYYVVAIFVIIFWLIVSDNNFRIVKSNGIGAALDRIFLIPTILVYTPFFLCTIILTHLYFLSLVNKQEKKFLEQESLESQLNYQQLKNQLSPHFLFNNINVLTSLIEENPKKAVSFSESLSTIYRYFLEQEKEDIIVLNKEIDFAKDYLKLFQTRFETGLSYSINIKNVDEDKYVVSTTLQQVLENVIKHNEISNENTVAITIETENDYLVVTNNITPKISEVKSGGKGLENIKKRYAYFSDVKVEIIQNELNFTIKLPLLDV
ncbi:MAG: histidine kinase [Polaribacter sp.]|nr:histidine kinase [Polaribacter sp.]MDG1810467.1 histidine kinase [Polaribacter sp.]MDG1994813.1 histidine kinase [Polaribacter sp.]